MFGRRIKIKKLLGLLTIGLVVFSGCEQRSRSYSDSMPSDFNFISNIADNSYILDTYKDELTKTIDWELDTTISYQLPIEEKQKIYELLKEIDICKYPENYAPTSTVKVLPTFSYQLKFTISGVDYKINWKENTESEIKNARELRKLFFEIQKILENDDLIKKLPESKRVFF
jgi:hypothetical protein